MATLCSFNPTAPIGQRTAPAAPRTPRQGKIFEIIVKIGKKLNRHFSIIVLSSVKAILSWMQLKSSLMYHTCDEDNEATMKV